MEDPAKSENELIQKAWDLWFAKDYSWEGLKNKSWQDGKSLQDYWLWDPQTDQIRSKASLLISDELIEVEGQPTYHIAHLPLYYSDGTPTQKTTNREVVQTLLDRVIHARLNVAAIESDDAEARHVARANLNGIVFLALDLSNTKFEANLNANFNNGWFSGIANFASATFETHAGFHHSTFNTEASFHNATFNAEASFDTVTFNGLANFEHSTFNKNSQFLNANFKSTAHFDYAKFNASAVFMGANFNADVIFDNAIFNAEAWFIKTIFSELARFDSVIFSDETRFYAANFKSKFSFLTTRFEKVAYFTGLIWPSIEVNHHQAFDKALFQSFADFSGSGFKAYAAFDETRFEKGIRFDRPESETNAEISFYSELSNAKADKDPIKRLEELEAGCRVIHMEMVKQGDKHREQLLYRFELMARREQLTPQNPEWWVSKIYEIISDYGASLTKPLWGLLWLFLIFLVFYLHFQAQPHSNDNFLLSTKTSLSRMFPFGAFGDATKDFAHCLSPDWAFVFMALATLQSLFCGILIFLFALAVRRRFQIN